MHDNRGHTLRDVALATMVDHDRRDARLLGRVAPALRHRAHTGAVALRGGLVILSRWPITRCRFGGYPPAPPLRAELLMRKGAQLATIAAPGRSAYLSDHYGIEADVVVA